MLSFNNMGSNGTATGQGTLTLMVNVAALASGTRTGTVVVTQSGGTSPVGSVNITQP
jgi:hypothetical protein